MKKILTNLTLVLFFSIFTNYLYAQGDYNKTDDLGRKQGKWMEFYENGQLRYTGKFKNNEPVGEFVYYSAEGTMIGRGNYHDKKKQGKWEFFSEDNGALILLEHYDNGVLVDKSVVYNPVNQKVVEETEYVNGLRHGIYSKYYDNGVLMIMANYNQDTLDGEYKAYYFNGNLKEEGYFSSGVKIGKWKTYDTDGNILSEDIHDEENYIKPVSQDYE